MKRFTINTDGAARGNPGPGAIGFVIKDPQGTVIDKDCQTIGLSTNNVAEYTAVKKAFEKLINSYSDHLPAEIEVLADSMLIVNQLAGKFKIKNDNLLTLWQEVKKLESVVGQVSYRYIPREENYLADQLANKALDS